MKAGANELWISPPYENSEAKAFCADFQAPSARRFVLGRNEYARSIARAIEVEGFIDDFTEESEYLGKPIVPIERVPCDALVVSAVVGRPLTAESRLNEYKLRNLDYFAFHKHTILDVIPVTFWDECHRDFEDHRDKYEWIFDRLIDDESRMVFQRVINFRLSKDIKFVRGFTDAQHRQYFEDFLKLQSSGETFVDVGCFDGATSLQFIGHCPDYAAIVVFEPEEENMKIVRERLAGYQRMQFHQLGLSDRSETLRFASSGSCSRITEQGDTEITVRKLDDVLEDPFTFLKMDIEGAEMAALEGARQAIRKCHPRLAISAYHRVDDLWRIPERILSYRSDYDIYLRHYTEGISETVMSFVPRVDSK